MKRKAPEEAAAGLLAGIAIIIGGTILVMVALPVLVFLVRGAWELAGALGR